MNQARNWQLGRKRWFEFWVETIADFLFPPFCLACGKNGAWICQNCTNSMKNCQLGWCGFCERIGLENTTICQRCRKSRDIKSIRACFSYKGTAEKIIQTIKFRPAAVGIKALTNNELVKERLKLDNEPYILVPIPCSAAHERRRGFNQAELIAKIIAGDNPNAVVTNSLARTRETLPQLGLNAKERKENADNLFVWNGESLSKKRCVIIDDVATTGATVADAARALRVAGARNIQIFVLAQTPPVGNKL